MPVLTTTLTCPHCHAQSQETMRVREIERVIRCLECAAPIIPKSDDHCVWCAFSDTPCPVVQNEGSCNPC
jgi:cytochrome c-type biogenesis protein CcmH/NrfF